MGENISAVVGVSSKDSKKSTIPLKCVKKRILEAEPKSRFNDHGFRGGLRNLKYIN